MQDFLYEKHKKILERAVEALSERGFWSAYPEVPSAKFYGREAKDEGLKNYQQLLNSDFELPGHPCQQRTQGNELSPYGERLGISYPMNSTDELVKASQVSAEMWANASLKLRAGVCLEALDRLNKMSFEIAHATMHTTGQGFPMAFQAGGPHAQERGLEALACAWQALIEIPQEADWIKPHGKHGDLTIKKYWKIIPRGVSLMIGCNTFPTWNTYSGLFANLMTGNTVIVKPHPNAILPMAITIKVIREVLNEVGLPMDVVLLAAEDGDIKLAADLAKHEDIAQIDYTGSAGFADWLRENATTKKIYTEETGVNSIVIGATDNFKAMCQNIAFSLSLYSGQMCTSPQTIFIPQEGIETEEGNKSFDEVTQGIIKAIDDLLESPVNASMIAGAIANEATIKRIEELSQLGKPILRESQSCLDSENARTAMPLVLQLSVSDEAIYGQEHFGPISFMVSVESFKKGVKIASTLAKQQGAITAAVYETNQQNIDCAVSSFGQAGVNLSINLMGDIYVNQSAAFSDFHVTGANPAGNACFADKAFVANRFSIVMWRFPI